MVTAIILPGLKKAISENRDRLRPALSYGMRWYAAALILVAVAFCGMARPLSYLLKDPALWPLFLLVGAQIPLVGVIKAGSVLLPAIRRYTAGSMVGIVYSVCVVIGAGTTFLSTQDTSAAMMGMLLGAIPATILSVYLLAVERQRAPKAAYDLLGERVRYWTVLSLPAVLALGFLSTVDMWCVKGMLTDPKTAGLYATAYSISRVPLFLAYGLSAAVFPRVSEAMERNDVGAARAVVSKALRVLLLVFVGITAIVASSSSDVITLAFSARYTAAAPSLAILVIGTLFASYMELCLRVIGAADRPTWFLGAVVLLAIVGFLLNVLLIPQQGILGAAYAMAGTFVIGALIGSIMIYKVLHLLPRSLCLIRVASVGMIVFVFGSSWHPGLMWALPKLIILSLTYGVLLVVSGEMDHDDWVSARTIISRLAPRRSP
jgi:O-antigen/teichoic acid export membrane protein